MTNASLNDACMCYMHLMDAILFAAEFRGCKDQGRMDEAVLSAEHMKAHLCRQFEKPAESTWHDILTDAGLKPESSIVSAEDRASSAFQDSIEQKLDPVGAALLHEMQMHKESILAYAYESAD